MIYTLTCNPAVDKTVEIPGFSAGTVNRIQSMRTDIGGKGINVSKCLRRLGCDSVAAGFFGGSVGNQTVQELEENGIPVLAVTVAGQMRTNLKIVDPETGENTDINEPGPEISPENRAELVEKLDRSLKDGDFLILCGSVPRDVEAGFYRDLTLRYQQRGVKVFLDADGENLRQGIAGKPHLIKPNREELCRLFGRTLSTRKEVREAAGKLLDRGIGTVLVSLGSEGAILVQKEDCLEAVGLPVAVKSTVGAGDSMVAAMAYGWQMGLEPEKVLRLAVAISTASVMCSGTQAPEQETIRALYKQVPIVQS